MTTTQKPDKARPATGALVVRPVGIPIVLRSRSHWAVWRYEKDHRGAWSKPPRMPDGSAADGHDRTTWSTFEDAYEAYRSDGWDGISYAFEELEGIIAFDLDHIDEHQWRSADIVRTLDSFTERSPSGNGLHVWVRAKLPEGRRRKDDIEIYSRRRFLSLTGHVATKHPAVIEARQVAATNVWQRYVAD
jgi:putative DNA primase/helicase